MTHKGCVSLNKKSKQELSDISELAAMILI